MRLIDVLRDQGQLVSSSQSRRLVCMDGVKLNGIVVTDTMIEVKPGDMIQIGKRPAFAVEKGIDVSSDE